MPVKKNAFVYISQQITGWKDRLVGRCTLYLQENHSNAKETELRQFVYVNEGHVNRSACDYQTHLERLMIRAQVSSAALIVLPPGVLWKNHKDALSTDDSVELQLEITVLSEVYLLHDNNAVFGGRIHIHIVHSSPCSPYDFEIVCCVDNLSCHFCGRSHHQTVVVLQDDVQQK